jgi:hypothetical protein
MVRAMISYPALRKIVSPNFVGAFRVSNLALPQLLSFGVTGFSLKLQQARL